MSRRWWAAQEPKRARRIKVWAVVMAALFAVVISLGLYAAALETAIALAVVIWLVEWMLARSRGSD